MKAPCVYILANRPNGTLYIGVTSNLVQRVWQHKNDLVEGFTKRYGVHRLVWYEAHENMESAITREKMLKRWKRAWKIIPIRFEYTLNSSFLRKQESSPQLLDSGLRRSDDERPTIVFLYGRITTSWYNLEVTLFEGALFFSNEDVGSRLNTRIGTLRNSLVDTMLAHSTPSHR